MAHTDAVKPGAPYLYHYVIEAMIQVGMKEEAKGLLINYWGIWSTKALTLFGKFMTLKMIFCLLTMHI
jgi:hypothetical protein